MKTKTIFLITMLFILGISNSVLAQEEQYPQFPGGNNKIIKYIHKNVLYPKEIQEQGIEGTVYVYFTVKADGTITNIKIQRPINETLDTEAIRVIEDMPRWTAGNVDTDFQAPIRFKLSDKDKKKKDK